MQDQEVLMTAAISDAVVAQGQDVPMTGGHPAPPQYEKQQNDKIYDNVRHPNTRKYFRLIRGTLE